MGDGMKREKLPLDYWVNLFGNLVVLFAIYAGPDKEHIISEKEWRLKLFDPTETIVIDFKPLQRFCNIG